MLSRSNRGQAGIGTLIVFIAMILVAAITAGVLFSTADFLQNKSTVTGQQSSAQVTDRIQLISTYGKSITQYEGPTELNAVTDGAHKYRRADTTEEPTDWVGVSTITFIVMKSSGASDIQLNKVTLNYLGPNGAEQIILTNADVTIENIDGAANNVLSGSSDRARVVIGLNPVAQDTNGDGEVDAFPSNFRPLEGGTEATFELTTASGATITKTVTIPPTISTSDKAVSL